MTTRSSTSEDPAEKEFEEYFRAEQGVASLKNFHEHDPRYIPSHSNFPNVQEVWVRRFRREAKKNGVKNWNDEEPEWAGIMGEVLKNVMASVAPSQDDGEKSKNTSSKSTKSSGSGSGSSSYSNVKSYPLSESQKDAFREKYQQLIPQKKWKIGDGVYVEDVLHEFAGKMKSEHAAHSLILNLADARLQKAFTIDQIQLLEEYKLTPLPQLSDSIKEFLKKFKGKDDLEELWDVADHAHFDPKKEFELDWAKRSILDTLSAYRWETVSSTAMSGGERDLVMLLWRCFDTCFQDIRVQVLRSDQQSQAVAARVNESRLALDGSMKAKVIALKPDMILQKDGLEYGSAENGYLDESGVGEKELSETFLKLPKTLKDMMLKLNEEVKYDEATIRSLRVVGLVHSHLRVAAYVMDVPSGYVCRIRKIQEYRIPETLVNFYDTYIAFLEIVLKLKGVVMSTMEAISTARGTDVGRTDFISVVSKASKLVIPSSLNEPSKVTPRKRKTMTAEDDEV